MLTGMYLLATGFLVGNMTTVFVGMALMVVSKRHPYFLRSFTGDLVCLGLLVPVAYLFANTVFVFTFYSFFSILVWYAVLSCFLAFELGVTASQIVPY
jgi:hypothetical protein